MVLFASQVSQQIYASQLAMSQQMQSAQLLAMQMGTMPHMTAFSAATTGQGGMYGEQLAGRMANAGRTVMGLGGLGLGVAGAVSGLPLDPFSAAFSAGRIGFRMGGVPGMLGGAALGAVPFLAASQAAGVYTDAFGTGMREQAALNSTLRNTFNFQGGQGAFGRGFSQAQMGQIGQTISQEMRQTPFSSSQEINQLVMQGAESGMFTAVRDVETFRQRFRTMLDGLRKIQRELGGTLNEALAFTRGAQQLGIFTNAGRGAFAAEMRDTMATTGLDQQQLFSIAATGSLLSRATGGVGRQGAVGALRTARQLGAAVSTGAINAEVLSEATGGLQGAEAIQAFTARTLQMSDRFSRTARGRYSLFALANEAGTGLDQDMLDRFRAGDISVGGVMRDAHARVNRLGRARALNQEGRLRGSLMEEGGMSAQIGMMRLMVGDRALEGGDDLAQLVMQRRMGLSQQEAQVWTALMRNQGNIAAGEQVDRSMARRQTAEQRDIAMNRSVEAFMANFQHGLQDATGVTRAREMGRTFLTRVSSIAERAFNDFLGIQANALSTRDQQAITRLAMGRATTADRDRLRFAVGGPGGGLGEREEDPFRRSMAGALLHGLGMHGPQTLGEVFAARGVNLRGVSARDRAQIVQTAELARLGVVRGRDREQLEGLLQNEGDTLRRMTLADFGGGAAGVYRAFGGAANALDAFAARRGLRLDGASVEDAAMMTGPSRLMDAAGRIVAQGAQGAVLGGGAASLVGGPLGTVLGGIAGGLGFATLEAMRALETPQDRAMAFLARGGHAGREARGITELLHAGGVTGNLGAVLASVQRRGQRTGMSVRDAQTIALGLQDPPDMKAMQTILESDTFQSSIRRLQGLKGRAAEAELATLETEAMKMPAGDQRKAAQLAVIQLRHNLKSMGGIGREFTAAIQDPERRAAAERMYRDMGAQYDQLTEGLQSGALRDMLGTVGNNLFGYSGVDTIAGNVSNVTSLLARMDPNSAEYRAAAKALGVNDIGRGLLSSAAQERGAVTQLMGRGRRGRLGANEAALGMLTGNALGEMAFTVGEGKNRRTLSSRNQAQVIMESFRKGGRTADDLEGQLVSQLETLGVKDAVANVQQLRKALVGGVDEGEARELYKKLGSDADLQRVQREGIERAQRLQDPLGVQRNDLLKQILDKLPDKQNQSVDPNMSGG